VPQLNLGFLYAVKTSSLHYVSAIEVAGFKLSFCAAFIAGVIMFLLVPGGFPRDLSGTALEVDLNLLLRLFRCIFIVAADFCSSDPVRGRGYNAVRADPWNRQ
jgi:hypothetical protein